MNQEVEINDEGVEMRERFNLGQNRIKAKRRNRRDAGYVKRPTPQGHFLHHPLLPLSKI